MPTNTNTPGILSWNRLEPRPRVEDFDRTLKAEVRDPLWMMTRQWQFGEFQGEDTGSALFSRVHMKTSRINKIQLGNGSVKDFSSTIPMEADVEKIPFEFDLLMRLEMGRYWEQLLTKKLSMLPLGDITLIINLFRNPIGVTGGVDAKFEVPTMDLSNSDFFSNPELWHATMAVADGRAIDGKKLLDWLVGSTNSDIEAYSSDSAVQTILVAAKTDYINWFERNYEQPTTTNDKAWSPSQLEYQFSCSASSTKSSISPSDVLVADEYYQGSLDWFAFDFEKDNTKYDSALNAFDAGFVEEEKFTMIPTPITFAGMPHSRWWQMEDKKVDFGDINPSTSDTSKLIYSEFGLIYSNDWMIFPYTTKAGSLCDLKEIVVTDCFGQRTKIESANTGVDNDWKRWSFFGISTKRDEVTEADTRLFLPAVANKILESQPVEAVNFIRDEMANMVWGIEQTIPNGLGEGINGYETALKHVNFIKSQSTLSEPSSLENDAKIAYKIANSVPENWIPFIAVKKDTSNLSRQIKLQRAAMPRYVEGIDANTRIRPRTLLLSEEYDSTTQDWNPYFIHEEEVPRAGAIVKSTWQRTRTESGKVVTWYGRRKTTGKGEGSSNLAFDNIEEKSEDEITE